MAVIAYITRYSSKATDWQRLTSGQALSLLGGQEGDGTDLDLSDGEPKEIEAAEAGIFRILIDGGNARVRIGVGEVDIEAGEFWLDGGEDLRFVRKGQKLVMKAA